jgi:pimeloyl-ACP methyl ester carboxylesterase
MGAMERYVTLRGLRLYVREQGNGHPLLLINGLGGHADMWGPAEDRLSATSRTIVFDAPGTGRSSTSPVPLPLPTIAKLLTRVLDELGYACVDVAGYSLGGVMAQQFARTAPDRVRRLALVATSAGWGSAPPDLASLALISTPARYLSPQLYQATSHLLDGGDRFRDPNLRHAQAERRNRHPPSVVAYAQQFLQGSTWSSLHWNWRLTMPTLVLGGMRDRLVPAANAMLLAHRIPDSRLHLLPDEGHLMLFDPRSASSGLLAEFFSSPDHTRSHAWRSGDDVDDYGQVEQALRAAPGVQPLKALSGAYRAWVRGPVVKRVFGG